MTSGRAGCLVLKAQQEMGTDRAWRCCWMLKWLGWLKRRAENAAFFHLLQKWKPLEMAGIWQVNRSLLPLPRSQASHSIIALRYTMSLAHSRFCLLRAKFWRLTYCPQQVLSSRCCAGRRQKVATPACLGPVIPASPQCVTLHSLPSTHKTLAPLSVAWLLVLERAHLHPEAFMSLSFYKFLQAQSLDIINIVHTGQSQSTDSSLSRCYIANWQRTQFSLSPIFMWCWGLKPGPCAC